MLVTIATDANTKGLADEEEKLPIRCMSTADLRAQLQVVLTACAQCWLCSALHHVNPPRSRAQAGDADTQEQLHDSAVLWAQRPGLCPRNTDRNCDKHLHCWKICLFSVKSCLTPTRRAWRKPTPTRIRLACLPIHTHVSRMFSARSLAAVN